MGEWVELYNANDYPVTLDSWYIDDVLDAGANAYKFILNIPAKSYGVVDLPSAMFNNDGDTIRLLDRSEMQKDSITYHSVKEAHSLSRNNFANNSACFAAPTKGAINAACAAIVSAGSTDASPSPAADPEAPGFPDSTEHMDITRTKQQQFTNPAPPVPVIPTSAAAGRVLGGFSGAEVKGSIELNPVIRILSAASIGLSLLTIFAIFFRMKLW
jgi:hypothetical protein